MDFFPHHLVFADRANGDPESRVLCDCCACELDQRIVSRIDLPKPETACEVCGVTTGDIARMREQLSRHDAAVREMERVEELKEKAVPV